LLETIFGFVAQRERRNTDSLQQWQHEAIGLGE